MRASKTLLLIIVTFILGWVMSAGMSGAAVQTTPYAESPAADASLLNIIKNKAFGIPLERQSPHDRVAESQIKVYQDKVVLDVAGVQWASFTDTNSMDPIIDTESHALQLIPSSIDEIHIGDIVSYKSSYSDGVIIHRVIKIGEDHEGWYAIMRGDNLNSEDPEKVRFSQVRRVLIGIIY